MAEKGAKIKFTAETGQFNDSIRKANSEIKQMKAELNLASKQMSRSGETVEGLENKHKLLEQQLSASKSKTEALTQKINKAIECFGEGSTEVMNLRTQLANAKAEQEKFRISLDASNKKLDEQRKAEAELNSATNKLTQEMSEQERKLSELKSEYSELVLKGKDTSDEARNLSREIEELSNGLKHNKDALADASKKADEFDHSLDNAGDGAEGASGGFTVMKGALADLASEAIQWGIEKISEFTSYLAELPEATREFRQDMSTLDTSFEEAELGAESAKETWKDLYAVFGEDDRAVETANNISKMSKNQKDLNDWVTITTGVWGKYQDSLPVEGLAEASMESAKTGKVTGNLADALNWGAAEGETFGLKLKKNIEFTKLSSSELAKLSDKERKEYEAKKKQYEATEEYNKTLSESTSAEDKFNLALSECANEQERQKLITDTLTRLYGDAAETYRDTASAEMDAKEAAAEHMQAEAELAETIEPVTTEVTKLKTQFLEGLQPAIEKVSGVALDALDWMQEHPTAMKAIGAAVGTLAIGLGGLAIAAGVYTAAQWAMNSALLANPITWIVVGIVAAVALLVGAGVALYENWDKIKKKCSEMWSNVTGKFSDLKNKVVGKCTELKDKAVQKFNDLKEKASKKASELKEKASSQWDKLKEKTSTAFSNMKDKASQRYSELKSKALKHAQDARSKISSNWDKLKSKTSTAFSNMKDKATQKYSDLKSKVISHATNARSKVSSNWDKLKSKTSTAFSGAKDKAVSQFSSMKSKVVSYASGTYTSVRDKFNSIKSTISDKINSAKTSVTNAVSKIKNAFKFSWKIPKPSIPKFSVSGGKAPWGFGGKGSLPKIGIKWNKDGFIVNKASIIGQLGGTLMGAGEVEPEALTPISLLQDYINRAFEKNINNYAIAGGGSDVYNFYVNDAMINDNAEMRRVAKDFIEEIVRLGGMNR